MASQSVREEDLGPRPRDLVARGEAIEQQGAQVFGIGHLQVQQEVVLAGDVVGSVHLLASGVATGTLRPAVGLEDVEDLWEDLDAALRVATGATMQTAWSGTLGDGMKSKVVRWLVDRFGPDGVQLEELSIRRVDRGSDLDLVVSSDLEPALRARVRVTACRVATRDGADVIAWDAVEIGPLDLPMDAVGVTTDGIRIDAGIARPARGVPWFVARALGRED